MEELQDGGKGHLFGRILPESLFESLSVHGDNRHDKGFSMQVICSSLKALGI